MPFRDPPFCRLFGLLSLTSAPVLDQLPPALPPPQPGDGGPAHGGGGPDQQGLRLPAMDHARLGDPQEVPAACTH